MPDHTLPDGRRPAAALPVRPAVGELLQEFHTRPGADCAQPAAPTVAVPGALQRAEFVLEEARELYDAVAAGDLVKAADALGDVVYAAYGTAWRFGIDLDAVVGEVHRSNMTKTPAPGDGKAIKGPGFTPPDIASVLAANNSPAPVVHPRLRTGGPHTTGDVTHRLAYLNRRGRRSGAPTPPIPPGGGTAA